VAVRQRERPQGAHDGAGVETLDTTTVNATVDVASIDTAIADRDAHVLSPDIIDVRARPWCSARPR
jgi:polyisoprenoid-binding protein YceI